MHNGNIQVQTVVLLVPVVPVQVKEEVMEVFIISFPPNNCPNCNFMFRWDRLGTADFYAKAAQTCPRCGAKFQYVEAATIENVALKAGGDL